MDFTIKKYKQLLSALQSQGYFFQPFQKFVNAPKEKSIVLRHDVDLLPYNSLLFAKIQYKQKIKGSYYFRAVPESWDERIIKEIHDLDHEIGYHYENLTTCNDDINKAIEDFKYNLEKLRNLTPVSTICMHGSPQSKWDSKDLWKKYNYRDFGIIGEPYFDVDFDKVFYLTDTGRRWDGYKVSVRDKIPQQETWAGKGFTFNHTSDLIQAAGQGKLPNQIMMTIHPQRWSDKFGPWIKELVWQNVKNIVKRIIVAVNS
ncbi:MAG: hypothetical protein KAT74_05730 [Candidatus Cloacimonetes bacterium]|nr:hypothetical protein [Candidatus Cloacimonadota bacterium]